MILALLRPACHRRRQRDLTRDAEVAHLRDHAARAIQRSERGVARLLQIERPGGRCDESHGESTQNTTSAEGIPDARMTLLKRYDRMSVPAPDEDTQRGDAEHDAREDRTSVHRICLTAFGAAAGGEPSVMRPPGVGADQQVLPGVEIILQAGETPALSHPSLIRHQGAARPALAGSSVEQDLNVLRVLERVHQRAPQVLLVPCDDDPAAHHLLGDPSPVAADPFSHSDRRSVRCHRLTRASSAATPPIRPACQPPPAACCLLSVFTNGPHAFRPGRASRFGVCPRSAVAHGKRAGVSTRRRHVSAGDEQDGRSGGQRTPLLAHQKRHQQ